MERRHEVKKGQVSSQWWDRIADNWGKEEGQNTPNDGTKQKRTGFVLIFFLSQML